MKPFALTLLLFASSTPSPILAQTAPSSTSISPDKWQIDGGDLISVASRAGEAWAWGQFPGADASSKPVAMSGLKNAISIAAGRGFGVAVRSDGTVVEWGLEHGLWDKGAVPSRPAPHAVNGLSNALSASAGETFAVVLRRDGSAWAWGSNNVGQLGDGTVVDRSAPAPVQNTGSLKTVACGGQHALGLRANGTVVAWGKNGDGQLGDGTLDDKSAPIEVKNLTNIRALAAGWNWSLALGNDGRVWGWGSSMTQAVPVEDGEAPLVSEPKLLPNLENITAIAGGNWHALALKNDGTVIAWGNNGTGQMGSDGDSSSTPRAVKDLKDVAAIGAGSWHSLALKKDGTLWAWGNNSTGQIGDGSAETRPAPVQINF